jgi:hypothetical protein
VVVVAGVVLVGDVVGFGFGFGLGLGLGLDGVVVVFAGVVAGAVVACPEPPDPDVGARLPAEGSASAPGVKDLLATEFAARPTATATSRPAKASATAVRRMRI